MALLSISMKPCRGRGEGEDETRASEESVDGEDECVRYGDLGGRLIALGAVGDLTMFVGDAEGEGEGVTLLDDCRADGPPEEGDLSEG